MRWKRRSRSGDVIDARGGGMRPSGGLPMGKAGAGGAIGIVGLIVYLLISQLGGGAAGGTFGIDSGFPSDAPAAADAQGIPPAQDPQRDLRDFSAYVFSDVQDRWEKTFAAPTAGTSARRSCCTATRFPPGAAALPRRSGRSTARPTSACTSTSPSTRTWSAGWEPAAILPGPT